MLVCHPAGIFFQIKAFLEYEKDSLACGTAWRGGRQGRLAE